MRIFPGRMIFFFGRPSAVGPFVFMVCLNGCVDFLLLSAALEEGINEPSVSFKRPFSSPSNSKSARIPLSIVTTISGKWSIPAVSFAHLVS